MLKTIDSKITTHPLCHIDEGGISSQPHKKRTPRDVLNLKFIFIKTNQSVFQCL